MKRDHLMATGPDRRENTPERVIGRYAIYDEIASGGMAVVHLGRMLGQAGFSRTVAVKRLHPQFAKNPNFVSMFLDEARLAVRVQHPNVVAPLDVLVVDGEVLVVMEYVAGDTLSRLQRSVGAKEHAPAPPIIVSIMANALYGLHAAHEAVGEDGNPLHIVHRDVSPQNIMVGTNGMSRVLDFGVAKAAIRSQFTANGEVKGKLAYMAPEQVEAATLDRRTDVFAAGIVAWESLTRRRLFSADQQSETIARILRGKIPPPSKYSNSVRTELDEAILTALERDPKRRFQTAREFAAALERACTPATPSDVADWVKLVGGDALAVRAERVAAIETKSSSSVIRPLQLPPRISETHRVHVPAPHVEPDVLLQRSQSRITMPLINSADAPMAVAAAPAAAPSSVEPAAELANPQRQGRLSTLKARVAVGISGGSLLVAGLIAVAVRDVSSTAPGPQSSVSVTPKPTLASPVTERFAEPLPRSTPFPPNPLPTVMAHSTATADSEVKAKQSDRRSRSPAAKSLSPKDPKAAAKPDDAKRAGTSKVTANCNPPYIVDSKGIRRLRPECI